MRRAFLPLNYESEPRIGLEPMYLGYKPSALATRRTRQNWDGRSRTLVTSFKGSLLTLSHPNAAVKGFEPFRLTSEASISPRVTASWGTRIRT